MPAAAIVATVLMILTVTTATPGVSCDHLWAAWCMTRLLVLVRNPKSVVISFSCLGCEHASIQCNSVMCWQAAEARERWREERGAVSFQMPEARVRVAQPHSPDSRVQVQATGSSSAGQASQRLVSEMMILAGQAIAHIGQPSPLIPSMLLHL